ncbi:hypothetical protein [Chitinophaga sp. CF418]|uniref:hypothetical protein n=1 Tax=Chitinophaga sp. CF418 TaxID=1855287 RepID=UPI0009151D49|nr:hypothetical protein [Chitinophaga sp. CF418]SHM04210.1 hypothetical protein SAMN05216311_101452 [Chitinophaga sp. CF418]
MLLIIHSLLRWAIVLTGLWAIIRALKGVSGKTPYTATDKKAGLFFMISLDIQLLVGLLLYFVSSLGLKAFQENGVKAVIHNDGIRYFAVEHIFVAIVAIALVHIGRAKVKKATLDAQKHKTSLIFFAIALILLASRIPWPGTAAGAGRGWF